MAVSSRVFISYRRDDSPAYAGRLSDQLRARFGAPLDSGTSTRSSPGSLSNN